MGRKPVYTFATWRVKDGPLAAVLGVLAELMAKSTAEEGSLLMRDLTRRPGSKLARTVIRGSGFRVQRFPPPNLEPFDRLRAGFRTRNSERFYSS